MPKMIKKLSEREVRSAKPKDKAYKLYDEGGLRVLVRKTGVKVFQYPYTYNGKSNTYTIGKYCPDGRAGYVGLADARKLRDEVKAQLDEGIEPNRKKKAQKYNSQAKSKTTFEALGREWHSKGTWVAKHKKNILSALEKDVFPHIGHLQITKITTQDIIYVLSLVEERGAYDVAKRICQRCEAIFDYAYVKGVCKNNPALGRGKFVKYRQSKARPHLKETQLPEFLNKLDDYHGRDYIRLALKLLVITFVRPGELRYGLWSEIDFKKRLWRIPAERMKMDRDHIVPLSRQAVLILKELHEITGHSDLLFPGLRSPHKPISDVTLLKVIQLLGYVDENKITPHGFRHTASTILNEHRFDKDFIEKQLAHKDKNRVRSVYNHAEYLDERRKMMQWYADHMDDLKSKGQNAV